MSNSCSRYLIGIGFGTWAWGNQLLWGYKPNQDDEVLEETFQKAVLGGLSLVDTADSYGIGFLNGRSEELLGRFIDNLPADQREKIIIATKLAPYPWRLGRKGFQKAFFASQNRLNGHLHRIQLHWSTARYAPWQEWSLIENLRDLVKKGYIKEIGLSNMGPKRLKIIYNKLNEEGIKLKSLQIQFSLLSPEQNSTNQINVIDLCKELEIELIAYSPLALGILTIPPDSSIVPSTILRRRIFKKILPESLNLRKEIQQIAKDNGVSQAQVALNWCRSWGVMPIPGLRKPSQAEDAINALQWSLSDKEKQVLDKARRECQVRMPNNPFQSN